MPPYSIRQSRCAKANRLFGTGATDQAAAAVALYDAIQDAYLLAVYKSLGSIYAMTADDSNSKGTIITTAIWTNQTALSKMLGRHGTNGDRPLI